MIESAAVEAKPGAARHLLLQVTLTADHRCAIHTVSPYGCSHSDVHQSLGEADKRSLSYLQAIAHEWRASGVYAQIWIALHTMRRDAPFPMEAKRELQAFLFKSNSSRRPGVSRVLKETS